jgi:hypothetical protein
MQNIPFTDVHASDPKVTELLQYLIWLSAIPTFLADILIKHTFFVYIYIKEVPTSYSSIGYNRTEKLLNFFEALISSEKKPCRDIKTWNFADDSYISHERHK